jgi:aspartate kinase
LIIQKYGGSSVATPEKIKAIAEKIKKRVNDGKRLVVVVSAMGKSTNELIDLAHSVSDDPQEREMDMLLATGEQVSAALLSMALNRIGVNAISYNAFQLEMVTTKTHNNARIKDLKLSKLRRELKEKDVVVVTGFQGITDDGHITTLGRGGSDTSAVAIAAKLGAPCEIYSDVAGVYSCDPRVQPKAKKLEYITYEEMLELASSGAKVLHSRAVEIAMKYSIETYCASTFSEERGTYLVNNLPEWLEQPVVTGITTDPNQMKVSLSYIPNDTGLISRIFIDLAKNGVNVDMISTVNDNGHSHLTFTFISGNYDNVQKTLNSTLRDVTDWKLSTNMDVVKLSIVGVGMQSTPGVAGRFFETLSRHEIKMLGTTTSEIKISVLLHKDDSEKAIRVLAEEFGLLEAE